MSTFADRLNKVFRTAHAEGEPEQNNSEVAAALSEAGLTITRQYLSLLRKGKRTPSPKVARALARHFGVPDAYFTTDDADVIQQTEAEMSLLQLSRDENVAIAARQVAKLSPAAKAYAVGLLQNLVDMDSKMQQKPQKPEA